MKIALVVACKKVGLFPGCTMQQIRDEWVKLSPEDKKDLERMFNEDKDLLEAIGAEAVVQKVV